MSSSGDVTKCMASSRHGVLSLSSSCLTTLHCKRRLGNAAAQLLEPLAVVCLHTYSCMQTEAVGVIAQELSIRLVIAAATACVPRPHRRPARPGRSAATPRPAPPGGQPVGGRGRWRRTDRLRCHHLQGGQADGHVEPGKYNPHNKVTPSCGLAQSLKLGTFLAMLAVMASVRSWLMSMAAFQVAM